MASLDENGHEVLDQTPVDIPFHVDRPEPIHLRLRRIAEQIYAERQHVGEDVESLDEANDFEVEDDPSCYEPYPEPDYDPLQELQDLQARQKQPAEFTPEEREAAIQAIMNMRKQTNAFNEDNAGGQSGDHAAPAPAEPAS